MPRPRPALVALLAVALATAGCIGTPMGTPTSTGTPTLGPTSTPTLGPTGTPTPLPPGTVDLPAGPQDAPERPPTLNESSASEYASAYEYSVAYNSLWVNEHTDVTLECRVDDVDERSWGYAVVVTCTGYSNTDVPEDSTATPGPHADWFTQSYRYRVSGDATHREQVETRDPVS